MSVRQVFRQLLRGTDPKSGTQNAEAVFATAKVIRRDLQLSADRQLMLSGEIAALAVQARDHVNHISDVGFRVFSQWGEDGIIEWMISRIPGLMPSFVEFGVESYSEANTRFLLERRNWRGLVADSSAENVTLIQQSDLTWRHNLVAERRFIDTKNIDDLFVANGFAGEIGLLSIDVDGQDFWIWNAISAVNPQIIICEYNAVLGDKHAITVPFDPSFERTRAHSSNLYWGTSIMALNKLASKRGYTLVGSNLEGCNAFFVRNDLMPALEGRIDDHTARPSMFRESRNPDSSLSYIGGLARAEEIADMPVHDVSTGREVTIKSLGGLYSAGWLRSMGITKEN